MSMSYRKDDCGVLPGDDLDMQLRSALRQFIHKTGAIVDGNNIRECLDSRDAVVHRLQSIEENALGRVSLSEGLWKYGIVEGLVKGQVRLFNKFIYREGRT